MVAEYFSHFDASGPHQGLRQQTPMPAVRLPDGNIVALPVLSGFIMTTAESRETQYFGPTGEVASTAGKFAETPPGEKVFAGWVIRGVDLLVEL